MNARPLPRAVWVLGLVSLLMDLSSEIIHSLLPLYLVGILGVSALALGLLEGAGEGLALVLKTYSGFWSDRLTRRKPLVFAGYLFSALAKPWFALATGFGGLFAARLLDRTGKGLRGAPRDALVADSTTPEQRGAAFGLRQSLDSIGAFLGPVLAIALMFWLAEDIPLIFWLACIPAFLAALLVWLAIAEKPRQPDPKPFRWGRLGAPVWALLGLAFVIFLSRFSEAFLLLLGHRWGLAAAWTPLVLVGMNLAYLASAFPLGRLSDAWGRGPVLALGLGFQALSLGVMWLWPGLWGLGLGVLLWGLYMGATHSLLAAMLADRAPAELRGTAFGLFHLVCGVALIFGNLLAGWLWEAHGPEAMLKVALGLVGVAMVALPGGVRRGATLPPPDSA